MGGSGDVCVCTRVRAPVYAGADRGQKRCRHPRTEVTGSCELLDVGVGNSSPLKEQYMLSTAEPSIQSRSFCLNCEKSQVVATDSWMTVLARNAAPSCLWPCIVP